jgi:quercetin dioxygenase-like cupin family protein
MKELTRQERRLAERNEIHALEELMMSLPDDEKENIEELTSHFFAPGVYARMFLIKKGDVAIGKIHKTEHLNIICKGKVRVSTEDGPMIIEGPFVMNARPGVKKAVYALEDTWWINIHPTDKTDPDEIEKDVIANDYDEIKYLEDEL